MSLKTPKTLENVKKNLQPQMPELQFFQNADFSQNSLKV